MILHQYGQKEMQMIVKIELEFVKNGTKTVIESEDTDI